MLLTPLHKATPDAIEALLDAAFGTDRHQRTAYRLRAGAAWLTELSFAAWEGEQLVGTLQSWPVLLRGKSALEQQLVMVGPVAVLPERQGAGIGSALMARLIAEADEQNAGALMMIGDPEYYGRWGFTAAHTGGWRIDGPYEQRRLLARARAAVVKEGELLAFHEAVGATDTVSFFAR